MAQPTAYNQGYDFSDYQASNPSTPLPGDKVDIELAAIELTLDETLTNLALIQRDDGALANNSVGIDQLSADIDTGFISFDDWATSTDYVVRDGVYQGNKVYRCIESHTSGTFSVDLAANKWVEVLDFDQYVSAAATSASNAATSATNAATSATSASSSASAAAISAAAAAASAAEGMYNNVITITNADSPYVPAAAQEGTLFRVDSSAGPVVVNLSSLATYAEDMKFAFVWVAGGNSVTINRGGSDTINGGATSYVLEGTYLVTDFIGDSATSHWVVTVSTTNLLASDNSWTGVNTFGGSVSVTGADADFGAGGNRAFVDMISGKARIGSVNGGGSSTQTAIVSNNVERINIDAAGDVTIPTLQTTNGTWTPAFVSTGATFSSYAHQIGEYAKVGDLVTVSFRIQLSAAPTGTLTNAVSITGLPYRLKNTTNLRVGMVPIFSDINITSGTVVALDLPAGQTSFVVNHCGDAITTGQIAASTLGTNAELRGTLSYVTDV